MHYLTIGNMPTGVVLIKMDIFVKCRRNIFVPDTPSKYPYVIISSKWFKNNSIFRDILRRPLKHHPYLKSVRLYDRLNN